MALEYAALPFSHNYDKEILNNHNSNNHLIETLLQDFLDVNTDLTKEDFIVVGSACGSYMNYLIAANIKDIDIYFFDNNKSKQCIKTPQIDVISGANFPPDYKKRMVVKNGYYFLSKEDYLFSVSAAGIYMSQDKKILYTQILLLSLHMSYDELRNKLVTLLPRCEAYVIRPWVYDLVLQNINRFNTQFSSANMFKLEQCFKKLQGE